MHHHRRRKKRPNYGTRTVEVSRGGNGFGFTISGQQPCILSCIVTNSPADMAGLRAGDFLISVNGLNVSKLPHEAVVQLIGNSSGTIRMSIAENYYSDSSEEDNMTNQNHHRVRPKYHHNKLKINRPATRSVVNSTETTNTNSSSVALADFTLQTLGLKQVKEQDASLSSGAAATAASSSSSSAHNIIHCATASNSKDISNVSAMVRTTNDNNGDGEAEELDIKGDQSLEYRAIVGYLGTIEMPKQIATSSKLQTVRSCIRKMRQEKRNPTTVLMTILPSCLTLKNNNNALLATYPAGRLSYVSSSSENDNKFFGLVTSAVYVDGLLCESAEVITHRKDIIISNSCHVFVIDSKISDHSSHLDKAETFKIVCTKDPISNLCLEFPNNSEYVVNLIRSMYTLKSAVKVENNQLASKPPVARNLNMNHHHHHHHHQHHHHHNHYQQHQQQRIDARLNPRAIQDDHDLMMANSPQPSNHSEITTTSSNSDSGIGFHNDCANISDRILVVDFPGLQTHQMPSPAPNLRPQVMGNQGNDVLRRPCGIINDQSLGLESVRNIRSKVDVMSPIVPSNLNDNEINLKQSINGHSKSKSADFTPHPSTSKAPDSRLTVRAMPDRKVISNIPNGISSISDRSPSKDNLVNDLKHSQPYHQHYETVYPLGSNDKWLQGKTFDESGNIVDERPVDVPKAHRVPDLLFDFNQYNSDNIKNNLLAARSCDDMIMTFEKESNPKMLLPKKRQTIQMSIDDISQLGEAPRPPIKNQHPHNNHYSKDHVFLPPKPVQKINGRSKKITNNKPTAGGSNTNSNDKINKLMSYKLSPKVFGISGSFENLTDSQKRKNNVNRLDVKEMEIWGSLQELRTVGDSTRPMQNFLEGTYSEPDLRNDGTRALPTGTSPFRRWGQSSFRARSNEPRAHLLQRRPSSLAASENDVYTKSIDDDINSARNRSDLTETNSNVGTGVASWSTSFEKLIEDAAGLHTFAEFLKKEFSAENIYFWASCERYRQLDDTERSKEALEIFSKHLASGAPEPVNVDSQARTTAQENLQNANVDLFMQAQKQIFNLMKFDSYARFIRSDLFKSCLEAEAKNQPLPYPGDQLDAGLRTGLTIPSSTKLKKSLSNAEDRRRKSLLPWHRKTRCKSKDRGEDFRLNNNNNNNNKDNNSKGGNTLKVASIHSSSDIHSSRSSLSSFDAAITKSTNNDSEDNRSSLCRVILSDGATTIVQTRTNESIRELVERLLDKRGICYNAYEAFLAGVNKPLDLDTASINLAGKEVQIEQRVIFKLDLPNRKVISVKSKPCKILEDVLRPILHKYNYKLDLVQVNLRDSTESIDMKLPVTTTDGQRLQIVCKSVEGWQGEIAHLAAAALKQHSMKQTSATPTLLPHPSNDHLSSSHPVNPNLLPTSHSFANNLHNNISNIAIKNVSSVQKQPMMSMNSQQNTLDEITNKVFNELLQGKVESHSGQGLQVPPRASDQGSTRSEDWGSETSSGIFGRLRRNDSNAPNLRKNKIKKIGLPSKSSTAGSEDGNNNAGADGAIKKPLIAKWKAGVKLQVTTRSDSHDLLEGLKRAQRSRLEDQRGTEINFELPDFLKDKENYQNNKYRKQKRPEPFSSSGGGTSNNIQGNSTPNGDIVASVRTSLERPLPLAVTNVSATGLPRPQPAPRLSIIQSPKNGNNQNQSSPSVQTSMKNEFDYSNVTSGRSNDSSGRNSNDSPNKSSSSDIRFIDQYNSHSTSATSGNFVDATMIFNHHHHHHYHHQQTNNNYDYQEDNPSNDIFQHGGALNSSFSSATTNNSANYYDDVTEFDQQNNMKGPPPLPPKPKVLPIKPSNWGQQQSGSGNQSQPNDHPSPQQSSPDGNSGSVFKMPTEMPRRLLNNENSKQKNIYLDQPSSSFV